MIKLLLTAVFFATLATFALAASSLPVPSDGERAVLVAAIG